MWGALLGLIYMALGVGLYALLSGQQLPFTAYLSDLAMGRGPGAASPGPFWAAADKKAGDTSCVPRPCRDPGGTRPAPRPPGLFFHLSHNLPARAPFPRRAAWPLLPGPFPACARRSRAPRRQAAPFQTVSGLCPALRHARAVRPLLPGPFPACVRRSGTPAPSGRAPRPCALPGGRTRRSRPAQPRRARRPRNAHRAAGLDQPLSRAQSASEQPPPARQAAFWGGGPSHATGVRGQQAGSPGAGNVSLQVALPVHPESPAHASAKLPHVFSPFPAAPGRASSRPRTGALSSGVPARLAPHTRNRTSEISGRRRHNQQVF